MAEYRISQLAERTGFSTSTLRYYEQAGLLPKTARTPGGYRSYDDRTVDRLRFIARAKQLGLPLEEIRDLAAVWDAGDCAPVQDRLAALLTNKIDEVRDRIAELTAFGAQLTAARDGLGRQTPVRPCDDSCGCLQPTDERPAERPDRHNRAVAVQPHLLPLVTTRLGASRSAAPSPGTAPPIACTLTGSDQHTRIAEWADLLASATVRRPTDDGADVTFPPGAEVAGRVAALAAAEQECCRFFEFTVVLSGDTSLLRVRAPRSARDLVDDIFGVRR